MEATIKHDGPNGAQRSTPLSEVDLDSAALANSTSSKQNRPSELVASPHTEPKHVSTAYLADEEAGGNPNIERVLPEGDSDEDGAGDESNQTNIGVGAKKKKKKKPKSKRGLSNPNGFEDYYVDAPVTPADFVEEKSIYDSSYPFAQRVETAIQRYVAKRNLDSTRKKLFDRYLVHGGVEGGPKMFGGGLEANALATMNATEIAELSATNYVGTDKAESGDINYVVDFESCLKSFLSTQFPAQWELTSEDMVKYHVGIIRNFLNYLLHHDVCPEYKDQINAARAICDKAQKELWSIAELLSLLPGDFNKACSIIYGGIYQGTYSDNQQWMQGLEIDPGISPEQARKIFKMALAANADDEIFNKYKKQLGEKTCHITGTEDTGLEVTELIFPHEQALSLYAQRQCAGLKTIGKMKAKSWFNPNAEAEDLTEEEEAALSTKVPEIKHYEFWVEEDLLRKCFLGMKFEAKVSRLSFGVVYFDAISGCHCSFQTMIPNQAVAGWREPEKEWLPMKAKMRGRPSFDGVIDQDVLSGDRKSSSGEMKQATVEEASDEKSRTADPESETED